MRHSIRVYTTLGATMGLACWGVVTLPAASTWPGTAGTIWVANRGAHSIRGFDAATGAVVRTVPMATNSQPGDLAYANGKLYVAEEFGASPAVVVVDEDTGETLTRIIPPGGIRPHHVHASPGGTLVAVGLYGTDKVAIIDTHADMLIGTWDVDPDASTARVHAAVFSNSGRTIYLTSDATSEVIAMDPFTGTVLWRLAVPGAHELAITHDERIAYVSRRTANRIAVIDLTQPYGYEDRLEVGLPDTLRLSANEKLLTVGLRTTPARLAVVNTETFEHTLVTLGRPDELTTLGAHQWTAPNGRYTFAAYEGGTAPGVAVIDHPAGHVVVDRWPYPGRPHGVTHAHP
ncbi:hypothetical protein TBR22_A04580 [Luteitalea sp. TBR-22]|uniref:beta-propeller fold lactonase family protein n=1 Tax=Luteitalea sp. TBR-22 TaxID=2802971 RepID=UPI001AF131DF|nr:beta-propeller fold lactonase family protein [Luteitalea sp. TBR-22]BCS31258.1 hypothetical protein TBR22_A04580 [Luteitalea sp. TBR-22]